MKLWTKYWMRKLCVGVVSCDDCVESKKNIEKNKIKRNNLNDRLNLIHNISMYSDKSGKLIINTTFNL